MDSKAIPLIVFDRGGYKVSEAGLQFLNSIEGKVGVVAVVGKYRTGKSFLLNRVLLNHREGRGFGVGPTINPCTKGIWIWNELFQTENADGETMNLLVMDSEGLGAFDEDANHDSRIFLLSLLLSSYFIYNSVGTIDENALQSLSLIVNLSTQLQIRANTGPIDPEEVAPYFPSFMWVLRDFALRLTDSEGNVITPKRYLENALTCQKGTSDSIEAKNRIRRVLTNFFKDRECFPFIRPTEQESALQKLDEAPDDVFRPEFLSQASKFRNLVFRKVKAKTLNGQCLNGRMLGELAVAYTEAINKGSVPNIEGAWTNVCHAECQKALEFGMQEFEQALKQLSLPLTETEFEEAIEHERKRCLALLKDKLMGDDAAVWEDRLLEAAQQRRKFYADKNDRMGVAQTQQALDSWWRETSDKLKALEITDFSQFKAELEAFASSLTVPNTQGKLVLLEFKAKACAEGAEYISRHATQQLQNEKKRLEQQIEALKEQLARKKEDLENEKTYYKKRLEDQETEMRSLKASQTTNELRMEALEKEKAREVQSFQERIEFLKENSTEKIDQMKNKYDEATQKISQLQAKLLHTNNQTSQESALIRQELEFKKQEIDTLRTRNAELEANVKELRAAKVENPLRSSRICLPEGTEGDWNAERQYLLSQVQALKHQVEDSRSVQESLISALNKNSENPDKVYETNKHLSYALNKMEERCTDLEHKLTKLKKLKKAVKSSSGLQCKKCMKVFAYNLFSTHSVNCTSSYRPLNENVYISITQAIVHEQDRPVTEYTITVSHYNDSWAVNRRFKMLCNLHLSLQQQFPHVNLPDTSAIFSSAGALNKRPVILEERKKAIQNYLTALTKVPEVRESLTFRKFIGIDCEPKPVTKPVEATPRMSTPSSLALSPIINRSDY